MRADSYTHCGLQYIGSGHVSEKVRGLTSNDVITNCCQHTRYQTDAFAMGIILIELLISGAILNHSQTKHPETFPLEAREMVNSEDPEDLSAKVQALSAMGGWAGSDAQRAAKILADVAVSCTRGTTKRQKPAQVLGQLEAAHRLATSSGASSSGGGSWFS
jgi:hypothetical protein